MLHTSVGVGGLDKKNAEVIMDYLKDALERIASTMEEDFGIFLGPLLEYYLRMLDLEARLQSEAHTEQLDDVDSAEELVELEVLLLLLPYTRRAQL